MMDGQYTIKIYCVAQTMKQDHCQLLVCTGWDTGGCCRGLRLEWWSAEGNTTGESGPSQIFLLAGVPGRAQKSWCLLRQVTS